MHVFRNLATLFHNSKFLAQIRLQQTLGSTKSGHPDIKIRRIIRRSLFSCPWLPKSSQECKRSDRAKDLTCRYAATKLQCRSAAAIIFFFSSLLFFSLYSRPCAHSFPNLFSKFEIACPWDSGIIRLTFRESDPRFSSQFPVVLQVRNWVHWVPRASSLAVTVLEFTTLSLAPNLVPTFPRPLTYTYLPRSIDPQIAETLLKRIHGGADECTTYMDDIHPRGCRSGEGERVLCSRTSCGACEHSSGVVTIEFVNSCLDSSVELCFSGAFFFILRSGIWYFCSEFLFDLHWWTFDWYLIGIVLEGHSNTIPTGRAHAGALLSQLYQTNSSADSERLKYTLDYIRCACFRIPRFRF